MEPYELREITIDDVHIGIQRNWSLWYNGHQVCTFFRGAGFDLEGWVERVRWMNAQLTKEQAISEAFDKLLILVATKSLLTPAMGECLNDLATAMDLETKPALPA